VPKVQTALVQSVSGNLDLTAPGNILFKAGANPDTELQVTEAGIVVTGNVTASGILRGSVGEITGGLTVTGTIQGGNINSLGNITVADTLTTDNIVASANIGTANLTAIRISTNELTATASANLGQVGNVTILGGSDGQILSTDGAGNLSWISGGAQVNVTPVDDPSYTVLPTDQLLIVSQDSSTTINLPSTVDIGRQIIIKDVLGANRSDAKPIIISAGTNEIDGQSSFRIEEPYNGVTVIGATSGTWVLM
jgi:hypothetical protein